jgi:hypothetical protein
MQSPAAADQWLGFAETMAMVTLHLSEDDLNRTTRAESPVAAADIEIRADDGMTSCIYGIGQQSWDVPPGRPHAPDIYMGVEFNIESQPREPFQHDGSQPG